MWRKVWPNNLDPWARGVAVGAAGPTGSRMLLANSETVFRLARKARSPFRRETNKCIPRSLANKIGRPMVPDTFLKHIVTRRAHGGWKSFWL